MGNGSSCERAARSRASPKLSNALSRHTRGTDPNAPRSRDLRTREARHPERCFCLPRLSRRANPDSRARRAIVGHRGHCPRRISERSRRHTEPLAAHSRARSRCRTGDSSVMAHCELHGSGVRCAAVLATNSDDVHRPDRWTLQHCKSIQWWSGPQHRQVRHHGRLLCRSIGVSTRQCAG